MPARIAFCITTLHEGGAERQFVELVTRLPRDRFDPRVFVLAGPPALPADRLLRTLQRQDIPVSFLHARRYLWHTISARRAWTTAWREWQPALVQCFLAHANVLGALAGHRAGIPHILTGIRVAEHRARGHVWLQRRVDRYVTKHVCVSQSVAQFAAEVMGLPEEKLVVIPNGVDVQRFVDAQPIAHDELGVAPGRRAMLFLGRLDPQKRPDWLLRRMPALIERLPDVDLLLAGDGPMRGSLERLAQQLGVDGRVHFLGWRADVPRLLASAEVVLLTSAWEGMPNAILEAMAAARPVVVTDVHGAAELLGDHADGQLTPSNDPDAFVDAVVRLVSNRELAHAVGNRNQARARQHFSIDGTADSYARLYDSLLDG